MDNEALIIALGGLLHDIGKFVQRGRWYGEKDTHWNMGYDYLRTTLNSVPHAMDKFRILPEFLKYHHESELRHFDGDSRIRNLLRIVSQADNISSSERKDVRDGSFSIENALVSIFTTVNIGKGKCEIKKYPVSEYSSDIFFYPADGVRATRDGYESLFSDFNRKFLEFFQKNRGFNYLLHILERYTTFVPAMMTEDNDISLYDHLKTTSAISLCLYYFYRDELDSSDFRIDENEKQFLLVGGDISGIQDFIYTITSKGALKYLRARSAFLELFTEDVVEEIIEMTGLTRANVIYSGGGRFYILATNTAESKEKLKDIAKKANTWLFNKFWGKLYLALDYIEVSSKELKEFKMNGNSLWDIINMKLKGKKLRKFLDDIPEARFVENYGSGEECTVCKAPNPEFEEKCSFCESFEKMGGQLPKIKGFYRKKSPHAGENAYEMPFSYLVPYFNKSEVPKGVKVFSKNKFEVIDGCITVPFYVCDYYAKDQDGGIKDFDGLAKSAVGVKKIAVLRMDVDDLGKIFSMGLPKKEGTFSRIATMSRLFNHFFKNCLRSLAEGKLNEHLPETLPRISINGGAKEVVVVYSGGDDLFIVGAWNHVFELAFEINALFERYVGNNPNITVSAGYAIFDPKFPLYRMAEITGGREELAKSEGDFIGKINGIEIKIKGRLCFSDTRVPESRASHDVDFRTSYRWNEFLDVWNKYITRIYESNGEKPGLKKGFSRALIRKILSARNEYLRNPDGFRWSYTLMYHLSRAKMNGTSLVEVIGELAERDAEKIRKKEPLDIYFVDVPLWLVDFAIRGGG